MLVWIWRNGKLHALLVWFLIGTAIMEHNMEGPQKIKNRATKIQKFHFWEYKQSKWKH